MRPALRAAGGIVGVGAFLAAVALAAYACSSFSTAEAADAATADENHDLDAGLRDRDASSVCASFAPPPVFCDDFEGHFGPWSRVAVDDGGAVEIYAEPERGDVLRARIASSMPCSYANLVRDTNVPITGTLHVAFDLRAAPSASGLVAGVAFYVSGEDGGAECSFALLAHADPTSFIAVQRVDANQNASISFVHAFTGQWAHVEVSIAGGDPKTVEVRIDGYVVATSTLPAFCSARVLSSIRAGLYCVNASEAAEALIDDVVVWQ